MNLEMDTGFRAGALPLLASCGGTGSPMLNIAIHIKRSDSMDLREIVRGLVDAPGPIREIIETCQKTNGALDLEGLIRHFASFEHTTKMSNLRVTVARELPTVQIAFAHTLLPLTIVDGKYYYDCGDAFVELEGLVLVGEAVGSPYAHLASLIWLEDAGLHAEILDEQSKNGVSASAAGLTKISYFDTPKLRGDTIAGTELLFGKS